MITSGHFTAAKHDWVTCQEYAHDAYITVQNSGWDVDHWHCWAIAVLNTGCLPMMPLWTELEHEVGRHCGPSLLDYHDSFLQCYFIALSDLLNYTLWYSVSC